MITDDDVEFHAPSPDPMRAETNYFGFEIPEAGTHIGLYSLFRPNLGIVNSAVFANSRMVPVQTAIDFWDHRAYLPLGENRLSDFSLANGLRVTCLDPNRRWELRFDSEWMTVDVQYSALMPPYDIHDRAMDPLARDGGNDLASGDLWKGGHFDMTGAVEGTVRLHGRSYAVDWLLTMDHSWGVRGEYQSGTMTWLQAHFSRDFAVHAIFQSDATTPPGEPLDLSISHSYVMDHGEAVGVKAGTGRTLREGLAQREVELELVDVRDRVWKLHGVAQTGFPAEYWPGSSSPMAMMRWTLDGEVGYGTTTDFYDYRHHVALQAQRARAAAER
ncbi:hypothetical protein [Microbacterium sp. B19]|uniref:DUF7064 domain-containing protein n=1 Tax=Microbacterium sp. B19 TaxID=96765 RepID=UPI0003472FB5|nr:hypothetical protein [Microbacterium sp. B19]